MYGSLHGGLLDGIQVTRQSPQIYLIENSESELTNKMNVVNGKVGILRQNEQQALAPESIKECMFKLEMDIYALPLNLCSL